MYKIFFQEMLVPCLDCGYLCDLKGVKNFYTIYLINEALEVFFPTNWITRIHRDLSCVGLNYVRSAVFDI